MVVMWLIPVIRCRILSDHLIISFVILHLIRISESELSVVSERSIYLTIIKIVIIVVLLIVVLQCAAPQHIVTLPSKDILKRWFVMAHSLLPVPVAALAPCVAIFSVSYGRFPISLGGSNPESQQIRHPFSCRGTMLPQSRRC